MIQKENRTLSNNKFIFESTVLEHTVDNCTEPILLACSGVAAVNCVSTMRNCNIIAIKTKFAKVFRNIFETCFQKRLNKLENLHKKNIKRR